LEPQPVSFSLSCWPETNQLASGIGRQIALQYARRGASICVVARREQLLDTLLEDCRLVSPNRNANHIRFVADYSDLESLLALHDALKDGKYLCVLHFFLTIDTLQPGAAWTLSLSMPALHPFDQFSKSLVYPNTVRQPPI
jgi:NAD(P)-dependent dehydrogenase (short-subunit alcohol dehydrogenase family)